MDMHREPTLVRNGPKLKEIRLSCLQSRVGKHEIHGLGGGGYAEKRRGGDGKKLER